MTSFFLVENITVGKKMENTRLARCRRQMLLHEKRKRGHMSNYDSIQTITSTGEITREDGTINIS